MAKIDMAEMKMQLTRLLGFAPLAGLDALYAAMCAVPGPKLQVVRAPYSDAGECPMVAALFQPEPEVPFGGRSRDALIAGLQSVQRRLEVACQAGPFLPMDPAAACCPTTYVPRLLAAGWDALGGVLSRHGAGQQWDVVLRWTPEDVVARHRSEIAPAAALGQQALADAVGVALRSERVRRESALLAALAPAVLAFARGGAACTETQVLVTVLVESGGDAAIEAALDGMAAEHVEGASIDMHGPLPPLSFFPVRVAAVDEQAVTGAWSTLGLADDVDLAGLHRRWRERAAAAHPDRQPAHAGGAANQAVSNLTDAYRLLHDLLAAVVGERAGTDAGRADTGPLAHLEEKAAVHTLDSLLRRAGHRLIMPADTTSRTPLPERAPEHMRRAASKLLA